MRPPRWDDPIASACAEAEPVILRGLQVRPTLYGFVEDEPVVRVQTGLAELGGGEAMHHHLVVVPALLDLDQVLLFSNARLTDHAIGDTDVRDVTASFGLTVERAYLRDGEVVTEASLIEREVVDGVVRWGSPTVLPEGVWSELLRLAVAAPPGVLKRGPTPAAAAYSLSREGTVVEVSPAGRERLGPVQLQRRGVRAVDRRRARDLQRPRRSAGTPLTAGEVRA